MKIGELARRVGVTTKAVRYYESIGVLPPAARAENGYREYGEEAVDRLHFVRDAQETGLSLTEISAILNLRSQGKATCAHVRSLLEGHLVDLDRHIATLQKTRLQLATLTERARKLDPTGCQDPNRCQTIEASVGAGLRRGGHPPPHMHEGPAPHSH